MASGRAASGWMWSQACDLMRSQLEFVWLEQVDDALEVALAPGAALGLQP